jgi:hypothetical protein
MLTSRSFSVCDIRSLVVAEPDFVPWEGGPKFAFFPKLEKLVIEMWQRDHESRSREPLHSQKSYDIYSENPKHSINYIMSEDMLEKYSYCGSIMALSIQDRVTWQSVNSLSS